MHITYDSMYVLPTFGQLEQNLRKLTWWVTLNSKGLEVEQNFVCWPDNDIPIASFAGISPIRAIVTVGEIWAGYNAGLCTTNIASTVYEGEQL